MSVRAGAVAMLAGVLLLTLLGTASAVTGAASTAPPSAATVRIEDVDAQPDGTTTTTVNVSGLPEGMAFDVGDLEVIENGELVEDPETIAASQVEDAPVPAVVLAIDTSGSLQDGNAIAVARAAARDLASDILDAGGLVSVVSFADEVVTEVPLTDDRQQVLASIRGLRAAGATALYDGLSRAVRIADEHDDGPRNVIVFSDGDDNGSETSLADLLALSSMVEIPVTSVRLVTGESSPVALQEIAAASGGRVVRIDDIDELGAAFDAISADLRNRVTLRWIAPPATERTALLNVVVGYRGPDGTVLDSDGESVVNPRLVAITPPRPVEVPSPVLAPLGSAVGVVGGIVAASIAVLLLAMVGLGVVVERRRLTRLDQRLAVYEEGRPRTDGPRGTRDEDRSFADRAADLVDVIPRPATIDRSIAARIEQADWPMRVGELLLMMVSVGTLFFLFIWLTIGAAWWLALPVGLIGVAVPPLVLQIAITRRHEAFADQLPDVLQVIAGALRAGHAFTTAVEGAVGEVDEPAASELRRASVEARLGRPMDEALLGVAERMGSVDLTWVVSALAVQREVGGNLAEVLGNVTRTLRARASVRRQVEALSAEGRLSANVISAIPFVMFVVLTIISPEYMSVLFEEPIGRVLIATGLLLLAVGIVWLRRLVRPKF